MGVTAWIKSLFASDNKSQPQQRPQAGSTSSRRAKNIHLKDQLLSVSQPSFIGRAYRSQNKRWVLGCRDSDGVSRGGYRDSGNGQVILADFEKDVVVIDLRHFARPMNGAVSDSGRFLVNDGGFGSGLSGDVVAIDANGTQRHRRRYSANIFNLAISRCGRYAAVQTCSSPSEDGNLFEILDIENAITVFSLQPATGWADDYAFDLDQAGVLRRVGVLHTKLGRFNYSASGVFEDRDAFQKARLDKGDYTTQIMAAGEILKSDPTAENARKVIDVATTALAAGASERPDWGANAHRLRAESFELLGELDEALKAYDQALAMNPKVGVKRRAASLRKQLGST
jgi:hypothetical protein